MIIISKYLIPKNYCGLTIYPFIFLKSKELKKDIFLINHEKIHIRQQKELLWLFFFLWYGIEFLILFFKYQSITNAYRNISFEKEAYINESNLNYLKNRKIFSFFNYYKQ